MTAPLPHDLERAIGLFAAVKRAAASPVRSGVRLSETPMAIFDVETTSADPATAAVVQLAAVVQHRAGLSPGRSWLINPGCPIPPEVQAIHGIGDEAVRDAPLFLEIADEIHASMKLVDVLCGYNALHFDAPILLREFEDAGHDRGASMMCGAKILDPSVWAKWGLQDMPRRRLSNACERFGIALEGAHDALVDARATGQLAHAMIQAHWIPDDLGYAMDVQAAMADFLEAEYQAFGSLLYIDRATAAVRMGGQKHRGALIDNVPRSYLEWCAKRPDVAPCVLWCIERTLRGAGVVNQLPWQASA